MSESRADHPRLALTRSLTRRAVVTAATGAGAAFVVSRSVAGATPTGGPMVQTDATPAPSGAPTVVLVHGAFADGSSFAGVVELLQDAGVEIVVPSNPLRGMTADSAYIASVVSQIPGPVLLGGHSSGGAIISNVGSMVDNVVGLVYIAGFLPEDGESLLDIEADSRDSILSSALVESTYPTGNGDETAPELTVDRAKFPEVFAGDLPATQANVLAAVQRPAAANVFSEPTVNPAWKTLPSWAVVATGDRAAGADVILANAERGGATITKIEASHLVMVSQPQQVTDVILTALTAVS